MTIGVQTPETRDTRSETSHLTLLPRTLLLRTLLPRRAPADPVAVRSPRQGPVLLIEDESGIRELVAEALTEAGYDVRAVGDGGAALRLLLSGADAPQPALIVLDLILPDVDGWEFATAYEALIGPRPPLVIFTALNDPESCAAHLRAAAYLSKPFRRAALLELVGRYALPVPTLPANVRRLFPAASA